MNDQIYVIATILLVVLHYKTKILSLKAQGSESVAFVAWSLCPTHTDSFISPHTLISLSRSHVDPAFEGTKTFFFILEQALPSAWISCAPNPNPTHVPSVSSFLLTLQFST